ncbi:hypothetical protein NDU88_007718 [Pleurodeles waltl]|uniref:Uncharacterized protein n=1 Tax=Pleurodeles waltl TaxID=8319 RepID=A0AAV7N493_PLEWA|nr:hypothetical protein NDU88_007718 [Pleurodeles waltl]
MADLFQDATKSSWKQVSAQSVESFVTTQFNYYRSRHTMCDLLREDLLEPPELPALTHLLQVSAPHHIIANLYALTQELLYPGVTKLRLDWQWELGITISDKQWTFSCFIVKSVSLNSRRMLLHFKYLNRVDYTPVRLFRYGLRDTSSSPDVMRRRQSSPI